MTKTTIRGAFEVALTPDPPPEATAALQRLTLAKTFRGELDGTSNGQMLAARTAVEGSAGYVALEFFEGLLDGRRGTFALQHFGLMDKGAATLRVNVVPDSGTGEFVGLEGEMDIENEDGAHTYVFTYALPKLS